MEAKKNLCGMIPENLHAKAIEEKEQLGLKTLGDYVELVLKERFEGGKITMAETKTLAFKITEELDQRLKNFIAAEKSTAGKSRRKDSSSGSSSRRWMRMKRRTSPQRCLKNKMPHRPLGRASPAACFWR